MQAPLVIATESFVAESANEHSLIAGGVYQAFGAPVNDWLIIGTLDRSSSGYAPAAYLTAADPSGHMAIDFAGETAVEIPLATVGEPVWTNGGEVLNGWVEVWLASGEHGAVPAGFIEWMPEAAPPTEPSLGLDDQLAAVAEVEETSFTSRNELTSSEEREARLRREALEAEEWARFEAEQADADAAAVLVDKKKPLSPPRSRSFTA